MVCISLLSYSRETVQQKAATYLLDLINLVKAHCELASDKHLKKTVDFVPHHIHWKHNMNASFNGQCEQDKYLQEEKPLLYEHLTAVLRQAWIHVELSFTSLYYWTDMLASELL